MFTFDKHLRYSPAGHMLLKLATYLDPRFKQNDCLNTVEWAEVRAELVRVVVATADDYPKLLEEVALWEQYLADHPDEKSLISLAEEPPVKKRRGGRGGRGRGRGRASCASVAGPSAGDYAVAAGASAAQKRQLKERRSDDDFFCGPPPCSARARPDAKGPVELQLRDMAEREVAIYDGWPAEREVHLDVLPYWRRRCAQVPLLALVARHVLGIPASTASLERLFSASGRA
eukprot:11612573-Karenia_brevis.AAC.1